ncbi:MAG: hypothetical protein EA361_05685 [Bacteroidetes bacterium]|nr:MAG: hypothetical protein EA361_05685 [Bacteroidota bacterium]
MKQLPNFLLISGSGQNSGKTTLVCRLISAFKEHHITAVKISPHFHTVDYELPLIEKQDDFVIFREIYADKDKDSSRFLKAGANLVLVVFCKRESLQAAVESLYHHIPPATPVICESGGLALYFKPGLHIFMKKGTPAEKDPVSPPDVSLHFDETETLLRDVSFVNNKWALKKEK